MKFEPPSVEWFESAIEILKLAARRRTRSEFERAAMFGPYKVGKSSNYQLAVLNRLIQERIVTQSGDALGLGSPSALSWLDDALLDGHQTAWRFIETYEKLSGRQKKFDASRLAAIGLDGEDFVVAELLKRLPDELKSSIVHESKVNDGAGYDIETPSTIIDNEVRFLEVKTSERYLGEEFKFYLSRNEFLRGHSDPRWSIVGVAKVGGVHKLLGYLQAHQIESMLPRDIDSRAKWQVVLIRVSSEIWRPGLP